jgi:hypothetical protein
MRNCNCIVVHTTQWYIQMDECHKIETSCWSKMEDRRKSISRRALPGKPSYLPPPPPELPLPASVATTPGSSEPSTPVLSSPAVTPSSASRARSYTHVIIKEGKKVDTDDFTFQGLGNLQSLALMDAVKVHFMHCLFKANIITEREDHQRASPTIREAISICKCIGKYGIL